MKTKLSLSFFFLIAHLSLLTAQVPQGFNYQAVAQTSTGVLIANTTLQVKIGILSDTLTPLVVWEELHSSVKTNMSGVFSLVIGTGEKQSGTAPSFKDIDWSVNPLYLRTQIYYKSEWKNMGSAKLWSVPYAMVAGDVGGSVKKLSIAGETTSSEEALFEVKNKDGQTIFAVYNEGVRVYVSDDTKALKSGFAVGGFGTDKAESQKYFIVTKDSTRIYLDTDITTKKLKGGFAVGGYDLTKGEVQNYLDVSSDSVRIYIDNTGKALKGGFAVGGFDMTKGKSNFLNVATQADEIINPSENRILWYPIRNAFLTGRVLIESPDSVGENSFSAGFESKATGDYSQALGYQTISRGAFSTALGKNAVVNGDNSFAFGDGAFTSRPNSFALGRSAMAVGEGSFSLGFNSISIGDDSYAIGTGAEALGQGSFALGFIGRDSAGVATGNTKATGQFALAMGMGSQATEAGAIALGVKANASGAFSTAIGLEPQAKGWNSMAFGQGTISNGEGAVAMGRGCVADGVGSVSLGSGAYTGTFASTAMGHAAQATGYISFAVGWEPKARGTSSVSLGRFTEANGDYSFATGADSYANGFGSIAMGFNTEAGEAGSIAIGHETVAVNGVAIGTNIISSGPGSIALGINTTASGENSIAIQGRAIGQYSTAIGQGYAKGDGSISFGGSVTSGANSFGFGNAIISKPYNSYVIGQFNDTSICYSATSWDWNDPLFIVGNGYAGHLRSNALTVFKDGKTAIGNIQTATAMLDVDGNVRIRSIPTGTGDPIVADASGNLFRQASDISLKTDIQQITGAINSVKQLRGVSFSWVNCPDQHRSLGLIAQEVERTLPEAVFKNPVDGYKGVNYSELVPVLIEAIKEQQEQIEALSKMIFGMREEIASSLRSSQ